MAIKKKVYAKLCVPASLAINPIKVIIRPKWMSKMLGEKCDFNNNKNLAFHVIFYILYMINSEKLKFRVKLDIKKFFKLVILIKK